MTTLTFAKGPVLITQGKVWGKIGGFWLSHDEIYPIPLPSSPPPPHQTIWWSNNLPSAVNWQFSIVPFLFIFCWRMIPSLFPWKLYDFPPNPSHPPADGKNWSWIQKSRAFKSAFSYYRMCTVLKILKARFKCCVANCNFSVLPNPSAPPASCLEVALPDSQDNLEVTSEVSEGCVDICCGCDSRYKWYDEEGKGIVSRRGPCCE